MDRNAPQHSDHSKGRGLAADGGKQPSILVVEDEFLLSCSLEEDIHSFGWAVVGPYNDLPKAMDASRRETFDLALLDINLNGVMVFPLADELLRREIPIVLLSGYSAGDLPERFRSLPRLWKPHDPSMLKRAIERTLNRTA
jgi:two-component SAPR family response regulator